MKKIGVLAFSGLLLLCFFNSCKQCNHGKEVVIANKDSVAIPNIDVMNEEIKKDSVNPFLYYKRAQLYEANNNIQGAIQDMFKALMLDSLRPEMLLYAAELFKKSGEPNKGIALMDKAIASDSMNTNYYVKAAELAYIDTTIKLNYRLSLWTLNAAIDKNPQNADIYFYKGNVFKALGDTNKAISSFQTATELNPKYYDAYVQLGLLLERRKDKNAQKYFDNAIKVKDKPEDALYLKANLLKQEALALQDANQDAKAIDKFNEAIESFRRVIELDHRNTEAYMGVGFIYSQMDSFQLAYKYYEMATKISPTYAGAYFSKGLCAEELGRTKEAIELYQNCLSIDPNFTRASEHLKKLQKPQ